MRYSTRVTPTLSVAATRTATVPERVPDPLGDWMVTTGGWRAAAGRAGEAEAVEIDRAGVAGRARKADVAVGRDGAVGEVQRPGGRRLPLSRGVEESAVVQAHHLHAEVVAAGVERHPRPLGIEPGGRLDLTQDR